MPKKGSKIPSKKWYYKLSKMSELNKRKRGAKRPFFCCFFSSKNEKKDYTNINMLCNMLTSEGGFRSEFAVLSGWLRRVRRIKHYMRRHDEYLCGCRRGVAGLRRFGCLVPIMKERAAIAGVRARLN